MWKIVEAAVDGLSRLPRAAIIAVGLVLTLSIGLADYATGSQLGASIFYLLPVLLVTWSAGRLGGLLIALASGLAWMGADLTTREPYGHLLMPYWNAGIRLGFFAVSAILLDGLKRERFSARHDPLTGLHNRRAFFEAAELELQRCRRYRRPLTLVYLDCDDFKQVNDTRGHLSGDALLRLTGKSIESTSRRTDVAARLGGDEFAILLPEAGAEQAAGLLGRLQEFLTRMMREQDFPVTFSMGAATFLRPPDTVDDMIRRADALMYSAKREGKNGLRCEVVPADDPMCAPLPVPPSSSRARQPAA